MKTKILPVLPLLLLSLAVSSCTGPTAPPTDSNAVGLNQNGGMPALPPGGGEPPGSSDGQEPQTPETAPARQSAPVETNAVVLTLNGGIPALPPGGEPWNMRYKVTNTSDEALTVDSVEVVNIKGSAFSRADTTCLDFVLPPRGAGFCSVEIKDISQGRADEGQLILGVKEDNMVKTLRLPQIQRKPVDDAPAKSNLPSELAPVNPPPASELAPVNPPPAVPDPSPTDSVSPNGQ